MLYVKKHYNTWCSTWQWSAPPGRSLLGRNILLKLGFFGGQVSCPRLWGCPRNLTSRELPLKKVSPHCQPCHYFIHVQSSPPKDSWLQCKPPPDKSVTLAQSNFISPLQFLTKGLLHHSVKQPLVSPILIVLLHTNCKSQYSVTNAKC